LTVVCAQLGTYNSITSGLGIQNDSRDWSGMTAQQPKISVLAGISNAMVGELLMRARARRMRIRMVAVAGTVEEMLEVAQKVPSDVAS
jgi:hypothetical protein